MTATLIDDDAMYTRFLRAHRLFSRSVGSIDFVSATSLPMPPFSTSTSLMGEKSRTILHSVADAEHCTAIESSDRRLKSGATRPESTRYVRRFFTHRERLRAHSHP